MKENEISGIIIDTALYMHKNLGSGLLENVYEVILAKILAQKGLHVQRQVSIPIEFEGECRKNCEQPISFSAPNLPLCVSA